MVRLTQRHWMMFRSMLKGCHPQQLEMMQRSIEHEFVSRGFVKDEREGKHDGIHKE